MRRDRERGGILGGLLIFFGILLLCGLALLLSTGYLVVHNIHVTRSAEKGDTRVETPFGSLRVKERNRLDVRAFGVPVYPGAQPSDDRHKLASFELDFGDNHKDLTVAAAEYFTSDPLTRVEEYYRGKLPDVAVKHDRHRHVVFEFNESGMKKVVALREYGQGTRIALASIGEAAAN